MKCCPSGITVFQKIAPLRSAKSNFYVEHDSASQIALNQISARQGLLEVNLHILD